MGWPTGSLQRLEAYNITIPQLVAALGNANINVGGREITVGQQSVNIRGVGLVDSGGTDDVTKGYKVQAMRAAVHAEDAAKAGLDIVEQQLSQGQVNQLAVLNAQQTYLTAAVVRVQTEANRMADTAALFMALGGSWPANCNVPDWRECAMGEAPLNVVGSSGDPLLVRDASPLRARARLTAS